jgi:hypothetical protein
MGFPTGWSFTTHQANFLAPLPEIEEEKAPTSTTLSHVNLALAFNFLAPLPGKSGRLLRGEFSHAHPLLCYCFALLCFFTCIVLYQKSKKN